jgi:hypothetical protein
MAKTQTPDEKAAALHRRMLTTAQQVHIADKERQKQTKCLLPGQGVAFGPLIDDIRDKMKSPKMGKEAIFTALEDRFKTIIAAFDTLPPEQRTVEAVNANMPPKDVRVTAEEIELTAQYHYVSQREK